MVVAFCCWWWWRCWWGSCVFVVVFVREVPGAEFHNQTSRAEKVTFFMRFDKVRRECLKCFDNEGEKGNESK